MTPRPDSPDGSTFVVTGRWTNRVAKAWARSGADALILNYARGFCHGDLEFLHEDLGVRRLNLLDRSISDLSPLERLGESLEELSVQAAEDAELDLGAVPRVRTLAGEWGLVGATLSSLEHLRSLITWRFDEEDLHAMRDHVQLERLTIKEAPYLRSLEGVERLNELCALGVFLARNLVDVEPVAELAASLHELELEECAALERLDDMESLRELRFLNVSDCGDIASLEPVGSLRQLELFHAWGSTRVVDGDLSPLTRLPRLREIRMRDRRSYAPRLSDITSRLAG